MSNTYDQYIERDDSYAGGGGTHRALVADNKTRINFFGATAIKEQWRGTILPPFDVSLIRDPNDTESYINSVGPCWTDVPDDSRPRFYLPGPWSRKFLFYTFLGESNQHFLSPRCRKNLVTNRELTDMDLADAFDDIRFFVRNSKAFTDAQRKALLERTRSGDRYVDAPVPQGTFRHVMFSEFWSTATPQPRVELLAITASAYKHLIDQMRWLVDERNPSIGTTCKQYLLGDVMADPAGALVWFPAKRVVGDFGEANVLAFTGRLENTAGAERRVVSQEALRSRFLLTQESNWNIPSYQEMVDFAVAELSGPSKIPLEIIKHACGSRADVPDQGPSFATAVQPGFDPMAAAQRYAPVTAPTPMTAPVNVAPQVPTSVETSYLVGVPGEAAVSVPASGLQAVLHKSPTAMVQMPDGSWLPLAASGLVQIAQVPVSVPATVPVSVPATVPAVPTVPANTAPSMAPQTTAATAPAVATPVETVEDYRRKICPDERFARLSPAGVAEVNEVAQCLLNHRLENKAVDAAMMQRVAQVSRPDYLG